VREEVVIEFNTVVPVREARTGGLVLLPVANLHSCEDMSDPSEHLPLL
jgi:hypothetical protein